MHSRVRALVAVTLLTLAIAGAEATDPFGDLRAVLPPARLDHLHEVHRKKLMGQLTLKPPPAHVSAGDRAMQAWANKGKQQGQARK